MKLLESIRLSPEIKLQNRIVMAPMTRCFSDSELVATPQMAAYYAKRSEAGLIITEATIVSPLASAFPNTPGIFNQKQMEGWKQVTDAVHDKDGKIFCQLWHTGRIAHSFYMKEQPVAPSAIMFDSVVPRTRGKLRHEMPRALSNQEVKEVVAQFVKGATFAIEAGFDGVEIHGANGYLVDQFLHQETNQRDDEYGGTTENRARFAIEIVEQIIDKIGAGRLGIRLSPGAFYQLENQAGDEACFAYLLSQLSDKSLAYVHISTPDARANFEYLGGTCSSFIRKHYSGNLMGCGDYTQEKAEEDITSGQIDLAAFGRPFISNPDFVSKCKNNHELVSYENDMLKQLI